MKVFFYRTGWAMLLYMLYDAEWEKTFYCFSDEKAVPAYFREHHIAYFAFSRETLGKSKLAKIFSRLVDEVRYLWFIHWLKGIRDKECVGDDDSILSKAFITSDFLVVEDGLANYTPQNVASLQKAQIVGFGCKYRAMGYDPLIKKILMSGSFAVPKEMKDKAICVDVRKLWAGKTEEQKDKILAVFGTTSQELDTYASDYVLLTQNFDVYDVPSTESEYSRYVKILKNYPYGKVLIKPHPASTFSYAEKFPDYKVVRQGIPFELMALYNHYKVLISINSTAAFTVPNKERIDLYDIDGDLKKRYYDSDTHKINAEEIQIDGLLPRWNRRDSGIKKWLRTLHWAFLRKFVWHLE